MTSPTESAASTLCTACGMCCDGTLFNRARVSSRHGDTDLGARGLKVIHTDEHAQYFEQPCPALTDRCCTIYADRPSVCANHRCKLLRELDAGATSLDAALAAVTETLRLRDAVVPRLMDRLEIRGPAGFLDLTERLHHAHEASADPNQARIADGELRMDVAMLAFALQRRFRLTAAGEPPKALDEDAAHG